MGVSGAPRETLDRDGTLFGRSGAADCIWAPACGSSHRASRPLPQPETARDSPAPATKRDAQRAPRPPTHVGTPPLRGAPPPAPGARSCGEPAPLVGGGGGGVQARLPPPRPCRSAAWVSRRALTPGIPSRRSHTAVPHLLSTTLTPWPPSLPPPPTRGRRPVSQPSWLGSPETAAVARPAATSGGGRRLCSRGAPPARCHTPPPSGAHHGQVAAGAFWGARLCHWWIFLNPAGGGGERTALPAAAPAAPAIPPLLSAATARLAPGGPARSTVAEMKVLGHRLQLLTGTEACRSPLPLSDLERVRGAVARVGRGALGCAFPVERNLKHAGLY